MEGYTTWMYCDVKGLVTTGVGNLIDTIAEALALPWQHPDGRMATKAEITAAWQSVKRRQDMKAGGGGAYAKLTPIRLSANAVEVLVKQRLMMNETILARRFPKWDTWPADAQMCLHSIAWAAGAESPFPKLTAHLSKTPPDFRAAANEVSLKDNPKRSKAQRQLMLNAAKVVEEGGCYDCLLGQERQAVA